LAERADVLTGPAHDLAGPARDMAEPADVLTGPAHDMAEPADVVAGPVDDIAKPADVLAGTAHDMPRHADVLATLGDSIGKPGNPSREASAVDSPGIDPAPRAGLRLAQNRKDHGGANSYMKVEKAEADGGRRWVARPRAARKKRKRGAPSASPAG